MSGSRLFKTKQTIQQRSQLAHPFSRGFNYPGCAGYTNVEFDRVFDGLLQGRNDEFGVGVMGDKRKFDIGVAEKRDVFLLRQLLDQLCDCTAI